MDHFIHPLADVHTTKIGKETTIWQFTIVLEGAEIGSNCNINSHCFIEEQVVLGDNVTLKCGVYIWNGIKLGNNVFVGPNVTFTNDNSPISRNKNAVLLKTFIEDYVSIGAATTILPGLIISYGSFIAAGSVLTKNTEPFGVYLGNPAKKVGFRALNGEMIDLNLYDKSGNKYVLNSNGPVPTLGKLENK